MLLAMDKRHVCISSYHPLPKQPSAKELIIIGSRIKRRRPEADEPSSTYYDERLSKRGLFSFTPISAT
jgi:hypothetical protein